MSLYIDCYGGPESVQLAKDMYPEIGDVLDNIISDLRCLDSDNEELKSKVEDLQNEIHQLNKE